MKFPLHWPGPLAVAREKLEKGPITDRFLRVVYREKPLQTDLRACILELYPDIAPKAAREADGSLVSASMPVSIAFHTSILSFGSAPLDEGASVRPVT